MNKIQLLEQAAYAYAEKAKQYSDLSEMHKNYAIAIDILQQIDQPQDKIQQICEALGQGNNILVTELMAALKQSNEPKTIYNYDKMSVATEKSLANTIYSLAQSKFQEVRMNRLKSILKEENKEKAIEMLTYIFSEVYNTPDVDYAVKQTMHFLINAKRGLLGKERKGEAMYVLVGKQHSGKSKFLEALFKAIHLGENPVENKPLETCVSERGDSDLAQNVFTVFNEKQKFDKNKANAIKSLITAETYSLRPLYSETISVRKLSQIAIASNSPLNDIFWCDNGKSRRLSQIHFDGIKKQMTLEERVDMCRELWEIVPSEFDYDVDEFVEKYNTNNEENEDEILEKLISSIGKGSNFLSRRHSVTDWINITGITSRDKIREYLSNEKYFTMKKYNNGSVYYYATDAYKAIVEEILNDEEVEVL